MLTIFRSFCRKVYHPLWLKWLKFKKWVYSIHVNNSCLRSLLFLIYTKEILFIIVCLVFNEIASLKWILCSQLYHLSTSEAVEFLDRFLAMNPDSRYMNMKSSIIDYISFSHNALKLNFLNFACSGCVNYQDFIRVLRLKHSRLSENVSKQITSIFFITITLFVLF